MCNLILYICVCIDIDVYIHSIFKKSFVNPLHSTSS